MTREERLERYNWEKLVNLLEERAKYIHDIWEGGGDFGITKRKFLKILKDLGIDIADLKDLRFKDLPTVGYILDCIKDTDSVYVVVDSRWGEEETMPVPLFICGAIVRGRKTLDKLLDFPIEPQELEHIGGGWHVIAWDY